MLREAQKTTKMTQQSSMEGSQRHFFSPFFDSKNRFVLCRRNERTSSQQRKRRRRCWGLHLRSFLLSPHLPHGGLTTPPPLFSLRTPSHRLLPPPINADLTPFRSTLNSFSPSEVSAFLLHVILLWRWNCSRNDSFLFCLVCLIWFVLC